MASSYCFLNPNLKDLAIAFRYNNQRETLRLNKDDKGLPNTRTFIKSLNGLNYKLYNRLYATNTLLKANDKYFFSGDFSYTKLENAYEIV